jgi:hypothetical protein
VEPRVRSLSAVVLVLIAASPPLPAQGLVQVSTGPTSLSAVALPPPTVPFPACGPLAPTSCPTPAPAISFYIPGGEAIDPSTGTAYVTDGFGTIASMTYPGCAPLASFSPAAWPPGPCGPIGGTPPPPISALSDAAAPGTLWVVTAAGLASLIPFPPGPPLLQATAPAGIGPPVTGIAFDPSTGTLWWLSSVGTVVNTALPTPGSCAAPSVLGTFPPPAIPGPYTGITVNTALPIGTPGVWVSNGVTAAPLAPAVGPACTVMPSGTGAGADLDFADFPLPYGPACGCGGGPTIGFAGGFPVLGNGSFSITAKGVSGGGIGGFLFLGLGSLVPPVFVGCGCPALLAPPVLFIGPVAPIVGTGPLPCVGETAPPHQPVPVPAGPPGLVGATVYLQWAFLPVANPCGFELSNALAVTIGLP